MYYQIGKGDDASETQPILENADYKSSDEESDKSGSKAAEIEKKK